MREKKYIVHYWINGSEKFLRADTKKEYTQFIEKMKDLYPEISGYRIYKLEKTLTP